MLQKKTNFFSTLHKRHSLRFCQIHGRRKVDFPNFCPQLGGHERGGIQRGAYHFFRLESIQGQINLFLKTVKLEAEDLPPVWDLETTGGSIAGELCDRAANTEYLIKL